MIVMWTRLQCCSDSASGSASPLVATTTVTVRAVRVPGAWSCREPAGAIGLQRYTCNPCTRAGIVCF